MDYGKLLRRIAERWSKLVDCVGRRVDILLGSTVRSTEYHEE